MTHDETLDLCRRWHDAFETRNLDALVGFYDEAATLESPMAGVVKGRDAVINACKSLFAAFPDLSSTIEEPLVDGERVAIVADCSGTHVGNFMGVTATNKRFRFRLVFLVDVRDGRIVRDRRIYDSTGLLVQVGALKAKPL